METIENTSIQLPEYRDLPITQLAESPTNPRKRFDEASLQELADSIGTQGMLAPLLVRELAKERFEIVAGSRRFRAARLAGLSHVPVRVVQLDDAEATLAQIVENLQRENVHPLEEAHGFRALLDLPERAFTISMIAAKSGKHPQYVASRLKLTDLIPPVAEAFLADKLTAGHALLIAKLPPVQQAEALQAAFKKVWMAGTQSEILVPVKELAGWIDSNLLLDLQNASFDLSDASLVPEAGACQACAKRTGANNLLFPEAECDQCLDRACYQNKTSAHIAKAITRNPKLLQVSTNWTHANGVLGRAQYVQILPKPSRNGKPGPEHQKCPHTREAIVVEGRHCGQVVTVCADPACATHQADARRDREAQERLRTEQRQHEEQRKQELATRSRVLTAVLDKVAAPLAKADLELIARAWADRLPHEYRKLLAQRHPSGAARGQETKPRFEPSALFKDLDESGYSRLLIEMSLTEAAYSPSEREGVEQLEAAAKRYRVNIQKIAASVAAEFAARRKKKQEGAKPKAKYIPSKPKT